MNGSDREPSLFVKAEGDDAVGIAFRLESDEVFAGEVVLIRDIRLEFLELDLTSGERFAVVEQLHLDHPTDLEAVGTGEGNELEFEPEGSIPA